jgi:hypothetical protein
MICRCISLIAISAFLAGCYPTEALQQVFTTTHYYVIHLNAKIDGKPHVLHEYWRCQSRDVSEHVFNAGPPKDRWSQSRGTAAWIVGDRSAISIPLPPCDQGEDSQYSERLKSVDDYRTPDCYELYYPTEPLEEADFKRLQFVTASVVETTRREYEANDNPSKYEALKSFIEMPLYKICKSQRSS